MLSENRKTRLMAISAGVLLALSAFLLIYYSVTVPVESSFGERYVNAEIPLIFPFYVISSFKPITLITYFIFGAFLLILETIKTRLASVDTRGLKVVFLVLSFASGYEVIWNFFAWFSAWIRLGGTLDFIANVQHAYSSLPVNFNFATKVSFLVFAVCIYGSVYFHNIERRVHRAKP